MSKGSITPEQFDFEVKQTFERIRPRVEAYFQNSDHPEANERCEVFLTRLSENWNELFSLLYRLYGHLYDFFFHIEQILVGAACSYLQRPQAMVDLDTTRLHEPLWYRSEKMIGAALYVDLFCDDFKNLKTKIPYLKEMGLTYVHLMPLFRSPLGNSDGGYAVSNYRETNPELGTIADLEEIATAFRENGISLVVDFVFNHTADDHPWAMQAQSGNPEYTDFYHIYPDRSIPDAYDINLREIFPTVRRGCFSWHDGMQQWVWTTFNSFQWDLKYANPLVFKAMMEEMLFLSNLGVEILRLDAVAFIWKEMGTNCENLDNAHAIIRTFNLMARIAAPGLIFKSEAIVHPDEVLRYIDVKECQLSYNPLLMALLWEAAATRNVNLLRTSIEHRHNLPEGCVWCNYLRSHDDIGWCFDDADAWQLGIQPFDHRKFLNAFYAGQFEGSFARGVPFQYNPENEDMRICGTLASLAGVEAALDQDNSHHLDMALRRMLMMHSVILSIGGIPLIYLGSEWALLNDYHYLDDPDREDDSRWVHRIKTDWDHLGKQSGKWSFQQVFFDQLVRLLNLRASLPALGGVQMQLLDLHSEHVLAYMREHSGSRLIVVCNFSEHTLKVPAQEIQIHGPGHYFIDHVTGEEINVNDTLTLAPYQFLWLERN